jgi:hypothetical protein
MEFFLCMYDEFEQNITGVVAWKEEAKHNANEGDPFSKLPPVIISSFKLEKKI